MINDTRFVELADREGFIAVFPFITSWARSSSAHPELLGLLVRAAPARGPRRAGRSAAHPGRGRERVPDRSRAALRRRPVLRRGHGRGHGGGLQRGLRRRGRGRRAALRRDRLRRLRRMLASGGSGTRASAAWSPPWRRSRPAPRSSASCRSWSIHSQQRRTVPFQERPEHPRRLARALRRLDRRRGARLHDGRASPASTASFATARAGPWSRRSSTTARRS